MQPLDFSDERGNISWQRLRKTFASCPVGVQALLI
jgi:hypothetical protein